MLKKKIIGKVPSTISGLSDTDIHDVVNGQALVYNAAKEKWVNGAGGSGGGAVNSVNGKTGEVELNAGDVGALPASTPIPILPNLAPVATSGSYDDLVNKPFIPDVGNKAEKGTTLAEYGITDGATIADRDNLQRQIDDILARLTGVTITVTPSSTTVNQVTNVSIDVTATSEADSITLYRGSTAIYTSSEAATHWLRTDTITPTTAGDVTYKAEVVIGGVTQTRTAPITVYKQTPTLSYGTSVFTAYLGTANIFPQLSNPNSLSPISYSSSSLGVATINSSGQITPVSVGTTTITASFDGSSSPTYNSCSASYTLTVQADTLLRVEWTGSLSKYSLQAGESATITKEKVTAIWASGKTLDVTGNATISSNYPNTISNSGTTYTAPNISGTDTIRATYNGMVSNDTLTVSITQTPVTPDPAYIGAGTSVGAVAVSGNATTTYGSGSQTYNVPVTSGDSIYILMPVGVNYSAFMGGQPMALATEDNYTKDEVTYTVKHTFAYSTTSTKTFTLNYT